MGQKRTWFWPARMSASDHDADMNSLFAQKREILIASRPTREGLVRPESARKKTCGPSNEARNTRSNRCQAACPTWKLRNPDCRVTHVLRLGLGRAGAGAFSLKSMSCLAACAETDAPLRRDRNAPAAPMSTKTVKARMRESGRRRTNSLQNALSQSMPG